MFADIVGFSVWSSSRGHDQVIHLLETVFGRFDAIAKELGIFKVETVGDCYLAVAGIPNKMSNHAEIMVQFASICLEEMKQITRKLSREMGPGTVDLTLRIGLHSGAITGGIMKGDRSRFQVFGDSVSTASRMESTSLPDRIQVSGATAHLLKESGFDSWVSERKDVVDVKGKGKIQVFWCHPIVKNRVGDSGGFMIPSATSISWGDACIGDLPDSTVERRDLLIDYNTHVLCDLLRKVVTKRNAIAKKEVQSMQEQVERAEQTHTAYNKEKDRYKGKNSILDQITEVVPFADFNPEGEDVPLEDLSDTVKRQVRQFVSDVADRYNDVPFHNFEHASHVMLSVLKLLNRIILPQNIGLEKSASPVQLKRELHDKTFGISSDPLLHFAVAMSALIHDLGHNGLSNKQLIRLGTAEAIKYEGRCVAEQHSIFMSREVVMNPELSEMRECMFGGDPEDIMRYREFLVNMVLATDIGDAELRMIRQERWTKAFGGWDSQHLSTGNSKEDSDRKATIVLDHIIQASDISHTMQHYQIFLRFNRRLYFELYSKFVTGENDEDPRPGWYKGEIGFFDFYVIPLAKKLWECGVFGYCGQEYYSHAVENRRIWEHEGQKIADDLQRAAEAKYGIPTVH